MITLSQKKKTGNSGIKNRFLLRAGFTLVETIVSIGLLSLVLGAFISVVSSNLRLSATGNQKYFASKIAQEGMELFQSKRNNNVICIQNNATTPCAAISDVAYTPSGKDWRYGLYERNLGNKDLPPQPPWRTNSYEIDGNNPNSLLPGATLPNFNPAHYLCQDSATSRFTYCGIPAQYLKGNFTREIRVNPDQVWPLPLIGDSPPLRVEVIVSWNSRAGGARQSISIEKHLFNTQP